MHFSKQHPHSNLLVTIHEKDNHEHAYSPRYYISGSNASLQFNATNMIGKNITRVNTEIKTKYLWTIGKATELPEASSSDKI